MPRLLPVMLIHGFGGSPDSWIVSGFRDMLVHQAHLDPDLIHLFHYGWDEEGQYNGYGDIRQIASRLSARPTTRPEDVQSQVKRLSEKSVARGGPAEVVIVAFSMGGLVARYWMSRRHPDAFGTVFDAPVAALITIGTPHLGVELAELVPILPADHPLWHVLNALERLPFVRGQPATAMRAWQAQVETWQRQARALAYPEVATRGLLDSPALRQLRPDSEFLRQLNRPENWPTGVQATLIWGDIRLAVRVRWGRIRLWEHVLSLGDLVVRAESASTLPGAPARRYPVVNERVIEIGVGEPAPAPATTRGLTDWLPPEYHSHLLQHEDVRRAVVESLASIRLSAHRPQTA